MKKSACIIFFLLLASTFTKAQTSVPDSGELELNSDTTTFTKVDIESEFPGGLSGWGDFLRHNFEYPQKAIDKNIQGKVVVQFVVCADGSLCDIKAISGPKALRETAVKVIQRTPNWIPAIQNGKKVKSYKRQPIIFKLE